MRAEGEREGGRKRKSVRQRREFLEYKFRLNQFTETFAEYVRSETNIRYLGECEWSDAETPFGLCVGS